MDEVLQQTLLYDFYGELLTEHQRRVYEEVVMNDISYSEAAQDLGVSRQGVHELVKRCNRILEEYESKLHLVEKFLQIRRKAEELQRLAQSGGTMEREEFARKICEISGGILEEL